jgi:hypothetical protein
VISRLEARLRTLKRRVGPQTLNSTKEKEMKALVSALAIGVVTFLANPALAGTTGAYVGDMLTDQTAAQAPDVQAENKARDNRIFKRHAARENRNSATR